MSYPHRIRLRGPWDYEPLATADAASPLLPGRMTMPCHWGQGGLAGFAGRVRFRRRFGFPGRLDAHDRVWLTCAGADRTAEVWLNGHFLGRQPAEEGPFEFEITSLLQVRNELTVEVEGDAEQGGLWGEVALEVRCTAWLRGVRISATGAGPLRLLATGEVAGSADRPLDLYLLLDRSTVAQGSVAAGQRFEVASEGVAVEAGSHLLRLELVNGATVWYEFEQAIEFAAGPPAPGE